ncbi:histidine kinase [Nonomuraea sp. NPDC000554]|uniref:sensor histidine kinase n=1 Tax=Nonomuraea sp. NPDC000554 TaxID=3154259 RepID=UPI00331EA66B
MRGLRRQRRREVVVDLLVWVLLAVMAAAMGPDPLKDPAVFGMVTAPRMALAAVAVLVGRAWPLAAVVVLLPLGPWDFAHGLATSDVAWPVAIPGVKIFPFVPTSPFVMWFAYLGGRRTARVWPAPAVFCAPVLIGVFLVLRAGGGAGLWITMVSALVLTYVLPYLLGVLRRRLLEQRRQAGLSLEAQARMRERARIARDMHDSLGHDLALIAVRAAGLELSPGLAEAQVKAAGELRSAAADATERLRQIIGLLRDESDPPPLAPVDEDVAELVERARQSGMAITLDLASGRVPGLASAVVQEGLTNAAKHAPGAAVTVTVTPHRVSVRNGPPSSRPTALPGGLGLAGLRERARLAGGALSAAPTLDGFELAVDLL